MGGRGLASWSRGGRTAAVRARESVHRSDGGCRTTQRVRHTDWRWLEVHVVIVQFVGAGDAFGSGGRFQSCISVRSQRAHVLLDCGASSLVALKRLHTAPVSIDAVI